VGKGAKPHIDKTESATVTLFEQRPLVYVLNQAGFHKQRVQLFQTNRKTVISRVNQ
jgi:hypothetical protein